MLCQATIGAATLCTQAGGHLKCNGCSDARQRERNGLRRCRRHWEALRSRCSQVFRCDKFNTSAGMSVFSIGRIQEHSASNKALQLRHNINMLGTGLAQTDRGLCA